MTILVFNPMAEVKARICIFYGNTQRIRFWFHFQW